MRIRLGIPTRRGITNVSLDEADKADLRDSTSFIADRFENSSELEDSKELLTSLASSKGWSATPDVRSYDSGDDYVIVTESMAQSTSTSEAKDKLSSLGVDV